MNVANSLNQPTMKQNGELWGKRALEWATIQEKTVLDVYEQVIRKLNLTNKQCLDIGCGSGLAAQLIHGSGASQVFGIDAADQLLEIAKERVPTGAFIQGDIEALPYTENSFDAAVCFNSIQYAGNPTIALNEAKRVVKPDGVIVVMVWGEPENMGAASLVRALKDCLPQPPAGAPGPFALSSEAALKELASSAGLSISEIDDVQSPWRYQDLDTALRGLKSAGVSVKAIEHAGEDRVDFAYEHALRDFQKEDGRYEIDAWFRCAYMKVSS